MEKIASFTVDHTRLLQGMYTSRIDGDITTYDIRMVKPNTPPYLENAGLHTFEHLFATYARNGAYSSNVIYVGPMGCRTGFYLLVRDLPPADAITLVRQSAAFIAAYIGEVPGASEAECGNYRDHDLAAAKKYARELSEVLKRWQPKDLNYR
ncbi:MAG: S-ribosylhomocysteine lyase [Clostridiales bacterium]|jgi:S-ribosylhomocysteine lyase|nr:S-ribosylhomocysteine lyase [Clostridiales bacterium]